MKKELIEGVDYELDHANKKVIFSKKYLLNRGYCCTKLCKNCPYGFTEEYNNTHKPKIEIIKSITTKE